jgi:type IV pilus assembly protein PilC
MMEFSYVAYTEDKKLVRGTLAATSEEAASRLLSYGGYNVLSLKQRIRFLDFGRLIPSFRRVRPIEIILFSRQLALLLESGTDIVTSLELLQDQTTNSKFKEVIGQVASDIRSGSSLSLALSKHPKTFSQVYHRAIAAGEQGGNLEIVLRNMADFQERIVKTEKRIRNALTYPVIVLVVAVIVIALLFAFVLPTFSDLYASLGTELPALASILINTTNWVTDYGLFLIGGFGLAFVGLLLYVRTPNGKYWWDNISLRLPVIGRILQLSELSRISQTISMLFRAGLPLPEIMTQAINVTNNKVVSEAVSGVQRELIRGEGLSKPMEKRHIFLPLMVQMVGVGEETGKLDDTLSTVATTYDVESEDRINNAVGLIQPIITVVIGLVVAFIAVALVSSLYSLYGEGGL